MTPFEDRDERLVAVFTDEHQARRAADALVRAGADPGTVRVGDDRDEQASLRGEMREELTHSVMGPGAVTFTKEMTKGLLVLTIIGAVVGVILATPLMFITMGGLPLWARWLIVAGCGALAGGTAGFVIGGSLAAKGPADANAAQRGVTVSVPVGPWDARSVLERLAPVRLDVAAADGTPLGTLTTEEQRSPGGTVQDLEHNATADDFVRRPPGTQS